MRTFLHHFCMTKIASLPKLQKFACASGESGGTVSRVKGLTFLSRFCPKKVWPRWCWNTISAVGKLSKPTPLSLFEILGAIRAPGALNSSLGKNLQGRPRRSHGVCRKPPGLERAGSDRLSRSLEEMQT